MLKTGRLHALMTQSLNVIEVSRMMQTIQMDDKSATSDLEIAHLFANCSHQAYLPSMPPRRPPAAYELEK